MKRLIYIFIILFIILVWVILRAPEPTNWWPTYQSDGTQPLDLKVLVDRLPDLLPEADLFWTDGSLTLADSILDSVEVIFAVLPNHSFSATDCDKLMDFARLGGRVFISIDRMPYRIQEEMEFDMGRVEASSVDEALEEIADVVEHCGHLQTSDMSTIQYCLPASMASATMEFHDSSDAYAAIGYLEDEPDLVRVPYGLGVFYLHCQPAVFSNYGLLYGGTAGYAADILGLLHAERVGIVVKGLAARERKQRSMVYVLSQHRSLTWAWNILLYGGLLFLYFGAKRRRSILPVVKPYVNASAARVRNLAAGMRRHDKNHRQLAKMRLAQVSHQLSLLGALNEQRPNQLPPKYKYALELYTKLKARYESGLSLSLNELQDLDETARTLYHERKISSA